MTLNGVIVPGSTSREVFIQFKADGKTIVTDLWGRYVTVTNPTVLEMMWTLRKTGYKSCAAAKDKWENIRSMFTLKDVTSSEPSVITPATESPFAPTVGVAPAATAAAVDAAAAAPTAVTAAIPAEPPAPPKPDRNVILELTKKWFNFFSEFHVRPQSRLLNSIFGCQKWQNVADLVIGYFSLTNHPDAAAIADKAKSAEFKELARASADVPMSTVINKRLIIFYGDPGTGKTTKAIEMFPEAAVMPCHSGMLSDDLYRQFDFTDGDGKPVFKDSVLVTAMKEGRPVILDEINLLTLECLRAIQALLDNKTEVMIAGKKVEIKDGFMAIGTMNLEVGGVTYGLPDPLVDRAAVIKKFELGPDEVAKIACPEAFGMA